MLIIVGTISLCAWLSGSSSPLALCTFCLHVWPQSPGKMAALNVMRNVAIKSLEKQVHTFYFEIYKLLLIRIKSTSLSSTACSQLSCWHFMARPVAVITCYFHFPLQQQHVFNSEGYELHRLIIAVYILAFLRQCSRKEKSYTIFLNIIVLKNSCNIVPTCLLLQLSGPLNFGLLIEDIWQ